MKAPPKPGSLREWVLILLLNKQEDIEHARLRAVVQVIVDKESGVEAFEDYMKVAFPYLEGRKQKEKDDTTKALMQWVKEGPMKVTPMEEKKSKSRLKQRVVARMASEEQQKKHQNVANKWKQKNQ